MDVRRKFALAVAVLLPLGGLAALGGLGAVASAGGSGPVLTCTSVGPGSGDTGGETFSGPSAGVFADAYNGVPTGKATAETSSTWSEGTNTVELDMLVVTGETFSIPAADTASGSGDNTFTVTSTRYSGSLLPTYPTTVTVVPALELASSFSADGHDKPLAPKTAITVHPTTATPYQTEDNITFASGSDTVTFPTSDDADLSGITFAPIIGDLPGGLPGSGNDPVPPDTYFTYAGAGTGQLVNDTGTGSGEAFATGTGTAVIGFTDFTSDSETPEFNLAATGCSTTDVAGYVAPTEATITGSSGAIQNSAFALEAAPAGAALNVSYPALPAGYGDDGGTGGTALSTTLDFAAGKSSAYYLSGGPGGCSNCDAFADGTATGDYATTAGELSWSGTPVFCTDAQLQAIDSGTGIDAAPGPNHVDQDANPLEVCDQTISDALTAGSPSFGSDGTPLAEVVDIQPSQPASAVI